MPSRVAVLAVGAAAGAVLLAGCRLGNDGISPAQRHKDISYVIDRPVKAVKVTAFTGRIEVVGGDGKMVEVREYLRYDHDPPATRHEVTDERLSLAYSCPTQPQTCWVSYRIEVPHGVAVDLRSDVGEVRFSRLSGGIRAETTAGFVLGHDLSSQDVTVLSAAGSITLGFATAPAAIDARTAAGAVTVRLPDKAHYAVEASTKAGSIRVSVPQDSTSPHRVKASSSAGSVSVLRS